MILSDVTIEEYVDSGKIQIFPEFDKADIRPTGIRVHLGYEILVPVENQVIDISKPIEIRYERLSLSEKGYLLKRDKFILASTYERIMTPRNIVCHLEGRSTIARLGLSIHCTSGIIDSNHDEARSIVLEMKNIGVFDLMIQPKNQIGMVVFSELSTLIRQQSQSQYKNQNSVTPPNLHFISDKHKRRS
ncbi:MAG: dCTP deaminase [Deltaproteobacteria bacterium]|nr:dCTP deaminase [Deltaproteobacteria bacterium]